MTTTVPSVRLRPHQDGRVKRGHPWVFSNEIADDVKALPPGGTVDVFDSTGAFVGRGYANPRSLIAIRILSRRRKEDIDAPAFFVERLSEALAYRKAVLGDRRSHRVVHAEGDGLPGLVIDRFDDVLAAQITTLGIEARKDALRAAIEQVLAPRGVVLRSDARLRDLEGLTGDEGTWWGEVPERIVVDEHGVSFLVDPAASQKTGHFFDQAENRRFAAGLCRGRRVLDLYCNTGGFGLYAAKAGAEHVTCVDTAEWNVARVRENAAANGVAECVEAVAHEAKAYLEQKVGEGRRYGVVMVDPPAFAKSRKVATQALKGYRDVNALALILVEEGGFLVTSSCSYHVEEARFVEAIAEAAERAKKRVRMVRRGEQAPDHPVLPAVPESRYLKHYVFEVRLA